MTMHVDYLQITIDTLVGIHENDEELENMSEVVRHMSPDKCQRSIADVVRYLMAKRDEG